MRRTLKSDKDVFVDGTVPILNTPGHTPGHHGLLVKLKEKGLGTDHGFPDRS